LGGRFVLKGEEKMQLRSRKGLKLLEGGEPPLHGGDEVGGGLKLGGNVNSPRRLWERDNFWKFNFV